MTTNNAEPSVEEGLNLTLVSEALGRGLTVIADLERIVGILDSLLLTGRPHAIADAAMALDASLSTAEPTFRSIGLALQTLGTMRLRDAAQQLRLRDQPSAAATADSLRAALKRFVQRNDRCHRRAQGLGRGLSISLHRLQAMGMAGSGRLIAEA